MIQVLYSCPACGLTDVRVEVRERDPDEDFGPWLDDARLDVNIDHEQRRPGCLGECELTLPDGAQIGAKQ